MNTNQRLNNTNNPGPEGPILALLFAATCVGAVIWAGAELAALIRYRRTFPASFEIVFDAIKRLPKTMSRPELAWPPEAAQLLPGPVLYWFSTFLVFAIAIAITAALVRVFRSPQETLDRRERLGVKTNARFATMRDLRPLLVKSVPPERLLLGNSAADTLLRKRTAPRASPAATFPTDEAASPSSGHHVPARARSPNARSNTGADQRSSCPSRATSSTAQSTSAHHFPEPTSRSSTPRTPPASAP